MDKRKTMRKYIPLLFSFLLLITPDNVIKQNKTNVVSSPLTSTNFNVTKANECNSENWSILNNALALKPQTSVDKVIEVKEANNVRTVKLLTDFYASPDDLCLVVDSDHASHQWKVALDLNGHVIDRKKVNNITMTPKNDVTDNVITVKPNAKFIINDSDNFFVKN